MFGRAIWDELPECIFENCEIVRVKREQFLNFQKWWANTNQRAGNYRSATGQLQNNSINCAMLFTMNRVIK